MPVALPRLCGKSTPASLDRVSSANLGLGNRRHLLARQQNKQSLAAVCVTPTTRHLDRLGQLSQLGEAVDSRAAVYIWAWLLQICVRLLSTILQRKDVITKHQCILHQICARLLERGASCDGSRVEFEGKLASRGSREHPLLFFAAHLQL